MKVVKKCLICTKQFNNERKNGGYLGMIQFSKIKYCSIKCSSISQIGVPKKKHTEDWKKRMSIIMKRQHALGLRKYVFTPEVRRKMSESAKNKPPISDETRRKLSEAKSKREREDVGYWGLHAWVYRKLGAPKKCQNCGTIEARKFEWCNISHEYKRDLSDWIRLCTRCHRNYDYGNIKLRTISNSL